MSDFVIDNNFEQLRKKVFVKERVQPIALVRPIVPKKVGNTTFKNSKFFNTKTEGQAQAVEAVKTPAQVVQSNLSAFLDSSSSA